MAIILLIFIVVTSTAQNFLSKQYGEKTKNYNLWLFSGMTMVGAFFFFLQQNDFQIRFVKEIIPITVLFTIGYAATRWEAFWLSKKDHFPLLH